jgi:hypothetical protein
MKKKTVKEPKVKKPKVVIPEETGTHLLNWGDSQPR